MARSNTFILLMIVILIHLSFCGIWSFFFVSYNIKRTHYKGSETTKIEGKLRKNRRGKRGWVADENVPSKLYL